MINNKWISVKDQLPGYNCRCLVVKNIYGMQYMDILGFCVDGKKLDAYFLRGKKDFFYDDDKDTGYFPCDNVTHWMPLPEPPKEDE